MRYVRDRLIGILVMVLMLSAVARNTVWKDEMTLAFDSLKKSPNNPRQMYNYALSLHKKGNLEDAILYLRRIIETGRQTWFVYCELGAVLADMGLYNDALYWQKKALAIEENPHICEFIGVTYYMMGDRERARDAFQKAIRLDKDSELANYYLQEIGDTP